MFTGLSLDQAPPFEAPLRFFLSAPLFGAAAGVFILFFASAGYLLSPDTLVIVHLYTLGFLGMVMIGALQQMLPVLAGVKLPRPLPLSAIIHTALIIGTISLCLSFYGKEIFAAIAAIALSVALIGFGTVTLYELFRADFSSATVSAMRLALVSLLITAIAGVILLLILNGYLETDFQKTLLIHAAAGLFGWISILIAGVSYQVIPMFYVTSEFPAPLKKSFHLVLFLSLIVISIPIMVFNSHLALLAPLFLVAFFALASFKLFQNRKRKITEPTIEFWYLSIGSILAALLDGIWYALYPTDGALWIAGVLIIYGFVVSLIIGMLYKIVPFLSWFHLSSKGVFDIPTMKEMIDQKWAKIHLYLHIVTLILLLTSFYYEPLFKPAGLAMIIENLILLKNLLGAAKIYFAKKDEKGFEFPPPNI